jgi:hypothetical protein
MRLTTAMFFTTSGRVIHKQGIEPDVVVPQTDDEFRKLMLQAIFHCVGRKYIEKSGYKMFVHLEIKFSRVCAFYGKGLTITC